MRHYHVEAYDERGRDLLPPRTLIIIEEPTKENINIMDVAVEACSKLIFSPVSFYVITELASHEIPGSNHYQKDEERKNSPVEGEVRHILGATDTKKQG